MLERDHKGRFVGHGVQTSVELSKAQRNALRGAIGSEVVALIVALLAAVPAVADQIPIFYTALFSSWLLAVIGIYLAEPLWSFTKVRRFTATALSGVVFLVIFGWFGRYEYSHKDDLKTWITGQLSHINTTPPPPKRTPPSPPSNTGSPSPPTSDNGTHASLQAPQVKQPLDLPPPHGREGMQIYVSCRLSEFPKFFPEDHYTLNPLQYLNGGPIWQSMSWQYGQPRLEKGTFLDDAIPITIITCKIINYGNTIIYNISFPLTATFQTAIATGPSSFSIGSAQGRVPNYLTVPALLPGETNAYTVFLYNRSRYLVGVSVPDRGSADDEQGNKISIPIHHSESGYSLTLSPAGIIVVSQ